MKSFWFKSADKTDMLIESGVPAFIIKKLLPVLSVSGAAGVAVGLAVTLFNVLLNLISEYSRKLFAIINSHPEYFPLFLAAVAALGFLMYLLIKKLPEARGSGIPRSEAMLNGKRKLNWLKMVSSTFLGSVISFGAGLSLGAEGPSVQLGSGLALGAEKIFGVKTDRRYVANGGAAAGVATAFGAPFTGIIFVQEEVQRKFNPLMLASCCVAVAYSYAVNDLILNAFRLNGLFFDFGVSLKISAAYLWVCPMIGIAAALSARFFSAAVLAVNRLASKSRIPLWSVLAVLFCVTAALDVFYSESAGSGLFIINGLVSGDFEWGASAVLLIVKLALILLCFRSGATGGIMVPMLTIGALVGALTGFGAVAMGLAQQHFAAVVLITMCAFFGTSISAPFTVIMLFLETTGGFGALLPLVLSVFLAQLIGKILGQPALYDRLSESEFDKNLACLID